MNKIKLSPKRKTRYRWMSIDSNDKIFRRTSKNDYLELTSISQESESFLLESSLPPTLPPKDTPIKSPKALNFTNKSKSKYSCPYYLSPKDWNSHSNRTETSVKEEVERIKNFYYHMHDGQSQHLLLSKTSKTQTLSSLNCDLNSLPPIQKYKQYLISKSLRLPSFLLKPFNGESGEN